MPTKPTSEPSGLADTGAPRWTWAGLILSTGLLSAAIAALRKGGQS